MTTGRESMAGGRRGRAQATRRRIVEAAYSLMSSRGYADATMADIAAAAGVAVQTVYFSFRNKPGLLRAVWAFAVQGGHDPLSPVEQSWFKMLEEEGDLRAALALALDGSLAIYKRVAPLASVFQTLADDPEIRDFERLDRELKMAGFARMVGVLAEKRPLRAGVSREDAVVVLIAMLGGETHRTMVGYLGWGEERWRRWTLQTLAESLFG